jgi:hypothetical protein
MKKDIDQQSLLNEEVNSVSRGNKFTRILKNAKNRLHTVFCQHQDVKFNSWISTSLPGRSLDCIAGTSWNANGTCNKCKKEISYHESGNPDAERI